MERRVTARGLEADLMAEAAGVYAFVFSRVRERETAEDLTQETLLAALEGGYVPERGALRPWLFGVALRKIVDHGRRQRVARDHRAAVAETLAVRMIRERIPQEWAERAEVVALVTDALALLPEETAFLLARKYIDGVRVADLAEEVGTTEKAMEGRLSEARLALHETIHRLWRKTP